MFCVPIKYMPFFQYNNDGLFHHVDSRDLRHNTHQYIVLGYLHGMILREHQLYLGSRTWILLYTSKRPSHEGKIFASFRKAVPKTPSRECVHASWISKETCWVINARVYLWRSADRCQRRLQAVGHQVQSLLNGY